MKDLRLVKKLFRRKRRLKMVADSFDRADKADKMEEVMAKSPRARKLLRGIQRRFDKMLGLEMIWQEPSISSRLETTLVRFDFDPGAGTDYGIKATFSSGVIAFHGIQPNDVIRILEGTLKGKELLVVSVPSATELRLEDVATYTGPESNVTIRANMSATKASFF